MTTNETNWEAGDHYFAAQGTLNGRAWDLGQCGEPCETRDDAESNAAQWLSDLSEREQARAETWVREYVIVSVETDGTIAEARTV